MSCCIAASVSNGYHLTPPLRKQTSAHSQRPQRQKDRITSANTNREKVCNNAKRIPKQVLNKPRKSHRERNAAKQIALSLRTKEVKPWKHLEPAITDVPVKRASTPLPTVEADAHAWLPEGVLETVLATDVEDQPLSDDKLRCLWNDVAVGDKQEDEATFWKFVGTGDPELSVDCSTSTVAAVEDMSPVTDYQFIEQSLASLHFCEDLPEPSCDSKLMPLFHENPISYMIAQSGSENRSLDNLTSSAQPFSCKHCQEAYEVVLDLEMPTNKKPCRVDLLRPVDSRLDFDWCKYNPPPWAATGDSRVELDNTVAPSGCSCSCEFCRSRTWVYTCKVCRTPL